MFYRCRSIVSLPDILQWKVSMNADINNMFYGCINCINLPMDFKKNYFIQNNH